ncbi:MAG: hypothetical protein Q7S21_07665 [archaeon]|nr:hypothetical protein [archaeon]
MKEELKPWIALVGIIVIISALFFVFGIPSRQGDKTLVDSLEKSIEIKNAEIVSASARLSEIEQQLNAINSEKHSLTISVQNLKPISEHHFEVWGIMDLGDDETIQKLSIATFNVNEKNEIINLAGYKHNSFFYKKDLSKIDSFEISIEQDNDFNPKQSEAIMLSGKLSGNNSTLSFTPLIGSNIFGSFILATPTNGFPPQNPSSNEDSGLWFVKADDTSKPSLNLPVAKDGWKYEAWIFLVNIPINLGKFSDASKADDYNGLSERMNQGFPAPGEDLLINALNIGLDVDELPVQLGRGDYLIKVSIEPEIDSKDTNEKEISQFLLFDEPIPLNAKSYTNYELEPVESLPSAQISLS